MHCHFMFGINAPTGFETIVDAVIKQLLAPYVTERLYTLIKEFGSSQTVRLGIVRVRIVLWLVSCCATGRTSARILSQGPLREPFPCDEQELYR